MKFLLYWSKVEQSFTLLDDSHDNDYMLEDDAKMIHAITAPTWHDAIHAKNKFLENRTW